MLDDCKDLTSYLQAYGPLLGARATEALDPLYVAGRDAPPAGLAALDDHFLRARGSRLFPAQKATIAGLVATWRTQKAAFLVGECGCGKSAIAAAAAHVAARGRPYRAMVLCPDHLIDKWAAREIPRTCPKAVVHTFRDWKAVLKAAEAHGRPTTAEWWVLGRDQSKGDPLWEPRFSTRRTPIVTGDDLARLRRHEQPWDVLTTIVATCPRCGAVVRDKDGNPLAPADLKTRKRKCEGTIVRHRPSAAEGGAAREVEAPCGEPLWQFVAARTPAERARTKARRAAAGLKDATAPYRWAPCRTIGRKMKGHFDYLILDEAHELKGGADVAQANAAGTLAASARKVVACTGTLIGGYADHLFPIMMRLSPGSLLRDGFRWNGFTDFNAKYGKIETTVRTSSKAGRSDEGEDHTHSKGSSRTVSRRCRPGVMPQLFGDHLLDKAAFLLLEQVAEGLPPLVEEIIPVAMDPETSWAYKELEGWFKDEIKAMLVMGDKRLLGRMLMTLLAYPDMPYGWGTISNGRDGAHADCFRPASLDPDVPRPKEEALLNVCRRERAEGRKAWVYITMTDVRDVGERLCRVLRDAGLSVGYLRSEVDRRRREAWIYDQAPGLDVVLSHPKLVETGFDLFDVGGNHNFPTLVFDQTGYNLFTLRQASRRSYRIGQPLPCRTVFLYYLGTMQERAMSLMGRKLVAAEALEGKFSAEGLAAMGEESDAALALARSLVDGALAGDSWRRDLGFADDAKALVPDPQILATLPAARPAPTTAPLTPAEIAVLKSLFGRIKGKPA